MKTRLLAACAMSLCLAIPAMAQATEIGVSMALFDDNFLTVLRNGMIDYAKTLTASTLQVEDAQNDVAKQLSQIQNFIAAGVDAIIVNPVDTDATPAMTKLAADAENPAGLRQPPAGQCRHAAREPGLRRHRTSRSPARWRRRRSAGCCGGKGNIAGDDGRALQPGGPPAHPGRARRDRHARVHRHQDRRGADRPTGSRTQGTDLMTNWITAGHQVRRRRLQQRRDGDRRHPGAEGGRHTT